MWLSLIGFNGSGKTTLAAEVGRLSGRTVVDLDAAVARAAGRAIPAIFAEGGPDLFRDLELRVLDGLPTGAALVVATGGGTLERPAAAGLLAERSLVAWLDAPWPLLCRRLAPAGAAQPSPLWRHLGEDGLRRLYRRRRPLFAASARLRLDAAQEPGVLARRLLGRSLQLAVVGPGRAA